MCHFSKERWRCSQTKMILIYQVYVNEAKEWKIGAECINQNKQKIKEETLDDGLNAIYREQRCRAWNDLLLIKII